MYCLDLPKTFLECLWLEVCIHQTPQTVSSPTALVREKTYVYKRSGFGRDEFLWELVSNARDAIKKAEKVHDANIYIDVDRKKSIIKIKDFGVGMKDDIPDKTDQSSSSAEEDNSASGALIRWIEVFWTALKTHASGAGLDDERDKTN
ncbi:hypothetical protein Bca101_063006 [Brassica carinata]